MTAPPPVVEAWRIKRSLGRAWAYSLLSFGLWGFWFVYQNRRLLDREIGDGRDDGTLHTVGSFVPIWNFFVIYWLWRDLNELRRRIGLPPFEVGLFVGLTIIGGAPITYSLVLNKLNEYWDVRSQGWASEAPTRGGEVALLCAGGAFLVLWLLMLVLLLVLTIALSA